MDASGGGIGRIDCYEDMFKEITKKLYGEDLDHRTSNVQNEFEAASEFNKPSTAAGSASASQDEDNASDSSWTLDDEPVKGCTEGTRVAAYRASTSTWRCYECGECMNGAPRDVAEHFVDNHSSRLVTDDRGRGNLSPRSMGPHIDNIAAQLALFRDRSERSAPPSRRTQMTQTIPATLMPVVSSSFLQLHDLPTALTPTAHMVQSPGAVSLTTSLSTPQPPAPQQHHQPQQQHHQGSSRGKRSSGSQNNSGAAKRYKCNVCPYSTDRRDLYTRHENIHREEKPFHCYICYKPFSRADHVKKHFLRMHKGHKYELARIKTSKHSTTTTTTTAHQSTESNNNINNNNSRCSSNASSYHSSLYTAPNPPAAVKQEPPPPAPQPPAPEPQVTTYQLQPPPPTSSVQALYQAAAGMSTAVLAAAASSIMQQQQQQQQQQPEVVTPVVQRRPASKSHAKSNSSSGGGSSGKNQERRYTCCYCTWSGVDSWCLKRHLNTHTKPFACALCEYKAARAERLATHVLKVHNRRQCSRCSYVVDDQAQLQSHQLQVHRVSNPSANADRSQQQALSMHTAANSGNSSAGAGRPPPGPPVFPPPSVPIVPATTVIPTTTMLGTQMDALFWSQGFPGNLQQGSSRRKQSMPRKCIQIPVEPVNPIEPVKPTLLVEPVKPIEPVEPVKAIEQVKPILLVEPVKAIEQVKPILLVEPVKAIEPIEPIESIDSVESVESVESVINSTRLYRCFQCPKKSLVRKYRYLTWRALILHKLCTHSWLKRRTRTVITLRTALGPLTKDKSIKRQRRRLRELLRAFNTK